MPRTSLLAATLLLAALLSGCGWFESDEPVADDNRGAEGEVLGGSISDAMIPLDTVQSQSPPLREQPSEDGAAASADSDAPAEEMPAEAPDEAEAPAPPPADNAEDG